MGSTGKQGKKTEPRGTKCKQEQIMVLKVKKGANKCGTKGKNRQVAALTLAPRRVRRPSGAVEESDREGGWPLVGERVWKLEPVVGG